MSNCLWKTKDWKEYTSMDQIDDSHLLNIISMLEKKAEKWYVMKYWWWWFDWEYCYYDEEIIRWLQHLRRDNYILFLQEALDRNLYEWKDLIEKICMKLIIKYVR